MNAELKKTPAEVDVAVLILFFNRPETLKRVFDQIRQARPSRLFLYQDGPRDERDVERMEACRKVVDDAQIDWECDVQRNYQTENAGCDPSNYNAQRWAFSLSDKVVVFEDDSVPSVSFIRFCKEMLDRYEHDERIVMIQGFNFDEVTPDVPYDYFFTSVFSIWGWASWRRVFDEWDEHYGIVDDDFNMHQLESLVRKRGYRRYMLDMLRSHSRQSKVYYESVFWSQKLLSSGLAIVPSKNMICNRGADADAVHYTAELQTLPRRMRRLLTMDKHELQFPLRHPRYVIENVDYQERVFRTMAWGHPFVKMRYSLEELWNNLRHGNLKAIGKAVTKRFGIFAGQRKFK